MNEHADIEQVQTLANEYASAVVGFCQRLIQTPSPSGQEGEVAELVRREMESLGYDEVWIDPVGNVLGRMNGAGGPMVMLNCHLDHVAAGDEAQWPHPPFSAAIHEGYVWGRGASDTKGALAPQVYALGALREAGYSFPGDVVVVGVVQEETNGLGTRNLLKSVRPDAVVHEPRVTRPDVEQLDDVADGGGVELRQLGERVGGDGHDSRSGWVSGEWVSGVLAVTHHSPLTFCQ